MSPILLLGVPLQHLQRLLGEGYACCFPVAHRCMKASSGEPVNMVYELFSQFVCLSAGMWQNHLRMKYTITLILSALLLSSCDQESQRASYNVSVAAHNFEVNRRAVFYNGITGEYILTIEGLLSAVTEDGRLAIIVKTGPSTYKKHYLGLSDNVTYFVEQLEPVAADPYHYRVVFRPTNIIPDMEIKTR